MEKWEQLAGLGRPEMAELLSDFAKRWLAHDGLWFQAVEKAHGLEEAMRLDTEAWRLVSPLEARRIREFLALPEKGGPEGLIKALQFRLYAFINEQMIIRTAPNIVELKMVDCRVQSARRRKGLTLFPCKSVGVVEYTTFAETVDPRLKTECIRCVPDEYNGDCYCHWRFTLEA